MNLDRLRQVAKEVHIEHKNFEPVRRNDRVMIIDGLNLFIRVFSAVPSLNDNGTHVGGVTGFLRSLALLLRTHKPTRCIITFDGKGGSVRRKKIFSEYKGNRSVKTSFNRYEEFDGIEDEQESMRIQFQRVIEYLRILPINLIAIDNIEADDSIAYITTQLLTDAKQIIIVSTDRDFLQLCDERVSVWSPVRKKLYTPEVLQEEYLVHANNYLIYRVITGDSGDNIPGIRGVGLKSLVKCFPQLLKEEEVSVDSILESCEGKSKKIFKNILTGKDDIIRNYKLMQLKEPDIYGKARMLLIDLVKQTNHSYNIHEFKRMFMDDRMFNVIKDVDNWLRTSFGYLSVIPE